jgi:hypothetical protein
VRALLAAVLQVTDEFRVDTDGAGDDTHDVLGERPRLVGADDGGVGHSLTRTEDTDKEFLCRHSLGSEGEGESHSERRTFGNRNNNQYDGNDQDACKGDAVLAGSTVKEKES